MNFERSLKNNVDGELSTSTLLGIVLLDSALLAKNVVFIELSWVVMAERPLERYWTELGSEVTCGVGAPVVWIIVETGKIETPCVVETFVTDTLGLRSGEEVMLRFILLPEVVTTVCGKLGVNASEIRVVVTTDVTDRELSTTKVCVSSGAEKIVV